MPVIQRYKKALTQMFAQLQEVARQPPANGQTCIALQRKLHQYIISVEKNIRANKKASKEIRRALAQEGSAPLEKATAKALKLKFLRLENSTKEYTRLMSILRSVGDGLVFSYLDRFDIKPMAFKQAAGFISGKEGSRLEWQFLKYCFKENKIAILNDLTNCMRYGDLTIIDNNNRPAIAEVKSGGWANERGNRQIASMQKLAKFFQEDIIDELYGFTGPIKRRALTTEEVHHRDELNALISYSVETGKSIYKQVEEGLYYIVETEEMTALPAAIENTNGIRIIELINDFKYDHSAYYPFTLSMKSPENIFRFYAGEFVVLVLVDCNVIESFLKRRNLNFCLQDDADWPIRISTSHDCEKGALDYVQMSKHFWGRLFVEFLSLNWFLEEIARFVEDKNIHSMSQPTS